MGLVLLVAWIVLSFLVAQIAEERHHDRITYLLYCLGFSPLIGFIILIASGEGQMGLKKCPSCAEYVQPDAVKCRYCQADLAAQEKRT